MDQGIEQAREQKRIANKRLKLVSAYSRVFDTPEGEDILKDICKHGFVTRSTFQPGDPKRSDINEGMRLMALYILNQVYQSEEKIYNKIKELEQKYNI